ncbi:MAG: cytochrome bc1 complex cytochrome b subunit [Thermoleophilia bacterium]
MISRLARWFDERLGAASFARRALDKVFPDHWSFMLGEIALFSFIILIGTGLFLAPFFNASETRVVYEGSYQALKGVDMSAAYRSTLQISFDVRAGLFVRQMHHWAALIFMGAISIHLLRIFFTGAFRRPREINWIIGLTLLALAMFNDFTGYSAPDDLLSGTGLRIAYSVLMSVPFIGDWLAFIMFGGNVPAQVTISRLYGMHVVIPFFMLALLGLHLMILWRQKHTNCPGPGRSNKRIVGSRMWPVYSTKFTGLFFLVFAAIATLGGLVEINPIWLFGPFNADAVSSGSQPDWYIIWLEGALRLFPSADIRIAGHTIPGLFFPGVILPLVMFGLLYFWPFIEARVTGDRELHHVLQPPVASPVRTAIGAAAITFLLVLIVAGSQDVVAVAAGGSVVTLRTALRILVAAGPAAIGIITYLWCRSLKERTP